MLPFADERFQFFADIGFILFAHEFYALLEFLHAHVAVILRSGDFGFYLFELLLFFAFHFLVQTLQRFLAGIFI